MLQEDRSLPIKVMDRSSHGLGWVGKKHGVGWARKVLMDDIATCGSRTDVLVSLDADTEFGPDYFQSILDSFQTFPDATGMSVPYYHPVPEDAAAARTMLRYEIYMRHYVLNLWRIGSPYSYAALGSAMACPIWAYHAVGGMTPKMSGEDFYFLQKLRKYGHLLLSNRELVYPAARFSSRVYFGTGPAMIKGNDGDWRSYPIYPFRFFDEIGESYRLVPALFSGWKSTRFLSFIQTLTNEDDPFAEIRLNVKTEKQFHRAFHERVDGLRILQYLKARQEEEPTQDEENLVEYLQHVYPEEVEQLALGEFSFKTNTIESLDLVRNFLFQKEREFQINSLHA